METFCSTNSMLMPPERSFCSTSMMSLMILGARPVEGSSSTSTSGCKSSARAMATICCWPPLSSFEGAPYFSLRMGKRLSTSSIEKRVVRCLPLRRASARFSATVMSPNRLRASRTTATPCCGMRCGGSLVRSTPPCRILPERARKCPLIVRTSVDLPAPLAPSRPDHLALADVQGNAMEDREIAPAGAHLLQIQQQFACRAHRPR